MVKSLRSIHGNINSSEKIPIDDEARLLRTRTNDFLYKSSASANERGIDELSVNIFQTIKIKNCSFRVF